MTDLAVTHATASETLVRSAARGDQTAFARLINEHNAAMARVAYVIVGDREATLDAVQSARTIAWRRIGNLRDPGSGSELVGAPGSGEGSGRPPLCGNIRKTPEDSELWRSMSL